MKFWSFDKNHRLGSLGVVFKDFLFETEDDGLITKLLASPSRGVTFDRETEDGNLPAICGPGFARKNPVVYKNLNQARVNRDKQVMAEKAVEPKGTSQADWINPEEKRDRELAALKEKEAQAPNVIQDIYEYSVGGKPWKDSAKAEIYGLHLFQKDGFRREVVPNPKGRGYCLRRIPEE